MGPTHPFPESLSQGTRRLPDPWPATPIDQGVAGDLDLHHASDEFPSEDTFATIDLPIDIDRDLPLAAFPPEDRLLAIIPADSVVARPCTADRSGRAGARVRSSSAWQSTILRVAGLRSAVGQFVIEMAALVQSRWRLTIEWARLLGSRTAEFISNVGRGVGWILRLPIQGARAAVVSTRRRARVIESTRRFLGRELTSSQRWRALNARFQGWRHATRAAFHHSLPWLRKARLPAAQFAPPAVIIASLLAAVIFTGTQSRAPGGIGPLTVASAGATSLAPAPIESRSGASASPSPALGPVSSAQQNSPATTDHRVDAKPIQSQRTSAVTSTAAIQRLLNRYRDAYSTLDVSAVRAIWPSVDANALRLAFDRLAEHNLDYHGCQISVGDVRAEAVCRGIAQSRHVGNRRTLTQNRKWLFVLSRAGDRWLIASVDPP